MLHTRNALPALAGKLLYQVAASVTATLVAAAVFASLPKATGPVAPAAAQLTSGGKFAARVPGVGDAGAGGAETLAPPPVMTMVSTLPFDLHPVADAVPAEVARSLEPAVKPTRSRPHVPVRAERSRPADAATVATNPRPFLMVLADAPREEDGVLPKIASSARSLWSMTTSTGGSLLSHLMP